MKIVCNKKEFAQIIRECEHNACVNECDGCIFRYKCRNKDGFLTTDGIEDTFDFEVIKDG